MRRGLLASRMRDRQPLVPAPLRLPAPLREYLREEAAGGIVLMAAAAAALAWANSPWQAGYAGLLFSCRPRNSSFRSPPH